MRIQSVNTVSCLFYVLTCSGGARKIIKPGQKFKDSKFIKYG